MCADDRAKVNRVSKAAIVAVVVLFAATACNKRLRLVDKDKDERGASPLPPSTATAPNAVPSDEDDPPVHMPHVPSATAKTAPAPLPQKVYPATCAGTCEKTLRCMNAWSDTEQAACVAECSQHATNSAKLAELNAKDCNSLLSTLKGGGAANNNAKPSTSSGGAAPQQACKADCYGCVWDGTSCYYLNGSMIGSGTVYCAACCCAKGGPAKRWE